MNTVFRVVFNAATRTFTAASEAAKTKRVAGTTVAGLAFVALAGTTTAAADSLENTTSMHMNRVTDVANGTAAHDAVNLEQLDGKVSETVFDAEQKRQDDITESNRITQDRRSNELSDRAFNAQKTADIGIKYEGDKVVKTDEDLKDTITGEVMHDRNGDALKVRKVERGEDKVNFRGVNGTTLNNVRDGKVEAGSREAVNGSQLKAVSDVANNSVQYDAPGETHNNGITSTTENGPVITLKPGLKDGENTGTTIRNVRDGKVAAGSREAVNGSQLNAQSERVDEVNGKVNKVQDDLSAETKERIKNDAAAQTKINDLYDTKADKSDVNEVRAAGIKESEERIKNDTAINGRVDQTNRNLDHESNARAAADENQQRQINTKADAREVNEWLETKADKSELEKEGVRAQEAEAANARAAQTAQNAADTANAGVSANGTAIDNERSERRADVSRLDDQKVDKSTFAEDQTRQDAALSDETDARKRDVADARDKANTAQATAETAKTGVDTLNTTKADRAELDAEKQARQKSVAELDGRKVDKAAFEADQRRQDAALDRETIARTHDVNNARQKAAGAQVTADRAQTGVDHLAATKADATDLKVETRERKAETASLEARKADKGDVVAETKRAQGVERELDARKADRSEVEGVAANTDRAHARIDGVQAHQKVQDRAIDNAQSTADAGLTVGNAAYNQSQINARDIQTLNGEVNAVDARSADRARKAEQNANAYTDSKVAGLKQDIKKVDRDAKAGVAAAIALGQLQAPLHAGKGNVSVGAGNWKGANAVSVGGGYRWNNDQWSAKGGVSFSNQGTALGGSVSYEF